MDDLNNYIQANFGVDISTLLGALKESPSSRGYIIGAISEFLLKQLLENTNFEVYRIIEKPSGGFDAKSEEARGDFYIRKKGIKEDKWFVIESKGLKSNAEFNRSQLDSKDKVYNFLEGRAFPPSGLKKKKYVSGLKTYTRAKKEWEAENPGRDFPPFAWDPETPGSESYDLSGLWETKEDLRQWVESFPDTAFTEQAYKDLKGPIALLDTHAPITRVGPITGKKQAAPLVSEFSIMAVNLFLRTGKHQFVYMNPARISHSPSSPEHLYQNYTIDILVQGKKEDVRISHPWYEGIQECIEKANPVTRSLDPTQIDTRL